MSKALDDWYAATQKMMQQALLENEDSQEAMKAIVYEWGERLKMIEQAHPGIEERYKRRQAIQKSLTCDQIDFICYQIGDWYVNWKDKMWADGKPNQHWLGTAKEQLKTMICGD